MAQIGITKSRPQFATVRYKVMDKAEKVKDPHGQVVVCPVNEKMADSRIKILSSKVIDKVKSLEEEDVLVVAGRGVRNEKDVEMCRELAEALGGQLAFTRPSEADYHLWCIRSHPVYFLYDRIRLYRSDQ